MSRFYRFYHYLANLLFWIFARRVSVRGVHHVPRAGPAILISDHLGYSAPASLIGSAPRQIGLDAIRRAAAALKRGDPPGTRPAGPRRIRQPQP